MNSAACGPWSASRIIILNILPESERSGLKFSLKIGFTFLAIILKLQVSNLNIFLVIPKKVTVPAGPWSVNVAFGPRIM